MGLFSALMLAFAAGQAPGAQPDPAAQARGLWFGPVQVCRDTVETAEIGVDSYSFIPVLVVTFKPHLHARIEEETARRVAEPLPVRLDGRIIQEPIVNEPIAGGSVQMTGQEEDMPRLREAALGPC
jgi:preprotein translocase subunit SecD